ncbi:MAG: helix-turn-helix transcriptional regulator [Clostridia bacterium]|nr:helix-turn-helix transcriptional regulator [Clostridia bacterium]
MFIKRLLELISEKGISRKQFNEDVQINKNQLKRWETAGTVPNRTTLTVIARYFGVSVEYLLGETDDRTPKEKSPAGAELSEKHQRLITAYDKSEPVVQATVDRLLGIDEKTFKVKVAARNGGAIEEKILTEEEYKRLMNLPDVEDI